MFIDHLDLEVSSITTEAVVGHIPADSRHHQPFGIVHGGVYSTLIQELALKAAQTRLDDKSSGAARAVPLLNRADYIRQHRTGALTIHGRLVDDLNDRQIWGFRITRDSDNDLVASGEFQVAVASDESPTA